MVMKVLFVFILLAVVVFSLVYFKILPGSQPSTLTTNSQTPTNNVTNTNTAIPGITQVTQTKNANFFVQNVVIPSSPQTFINDKATGTQTLIPDSFLKPFGAIRINLELAVKAGDKATGNAGYLFKTVPLDKNSQIQPNNMRSLYLFYSKTGKTWSLQYKIGSANKFLNLVSMPTGVIYGKV